MKRMLLIPAAGMGSRLQSAIPKALFPVNGRAMIDYLFELYRNWVEGFVLVVHPKSEKTVRDHCSLFEHSIEFGIQAEPTGMLDAILVPYDTICRQRPDRIWITWCDQIMVDPRTIRKLAAIEERAPHLPLIMPTIIRSGPYIHFERDSKDAISGLLQKREGDQLPETGEGDIGLFSLSFDAYADLLFRFSAEAIRGRLTNERNFLPFIPWIASTAPALTFPAHSEIESVGINNTEDLAAAEAYLNENEKTVDYHTGI